MFQTLFIDIQMITHPHTNELGPVSEGFDVSYNVRKVHRTGKTFN